MIKKIPITSLLTHRQGIIYIYFVNKTQHFRFVIGSK